MASIATFMFGTELVCARVREFIHVVAMVEVDRNKLEEVLSL